MKKRYILYAIFFVLTATLISAVMGFFNNDKPEVKNTSVNEVSVKKDVIPDAPQITEQEKKYLIKLDNGNLNVYDWNNNIIETLVVDFESMREYDKKQFETGIAVVDLEEIKHIAEDFSE